MSDHHVDPSRIPGHAGPGTGTDGVGPSRTDRPARPVTGDRTVDDVLAAFDRTLGEGPAAQAEAAAEAHRALQARLTAPTPPPAAPGEARPGPRR
jgi:hypothetical protein